jgi:hypothetical protein
MSFNFCNLTVNSVLFVVTLVPLLGTRHFMLAHYVPWLHQCSRCPCPDVDRSLLIKYS